VRDGAALVADNASGDILAYVGSAGTASRAEQVDGVKSRRQAGSTLKPFLYALAIAQRRLTAASLLHDAPIHLETPSGLYIPQNYDRDFKGWVSARTALAGSLNVPAVRTLLLTEIDPFRDFLQSLGYAGLQADGAYYGYSLALGSAEVSLLEQVNAFRTLANGGLFSPLRLRLDEPGAMPKRVLDEGAAFIIASVLNDPASRAITFGLDSPLATRFWSAVKTGTSKDMRDNWCVGSSRRYTVGVWVGNFEGDSMHGVSGVSGAAPAWLAILNRLEAEGESTPPPPPANVVRAEVRFENGLEPPRAEWFLRGTESETIALTRFEHLPARIENPPEGMSIVLDPDIPPTRQTLWIKARAAAGHKLLLDGKELGAADAAIPWPPVAGKHEVRLLDGKGRIADQVRFEVRGMRP
jgi:penicillin-binding protein 1C